MVKGHATNMQTATLILDCKSSTADVFLDFKEMDMKLVTEHQACNLLNCKSSYTKAYFPGVQDCRVLQNCHPDAECSFDEDAGTFDCFCLSGFVGNGEVCRPLQGNI